MTGALVLALGFTACGSSGKKSLPTLPTTAGTVPAATTTVPAIQTNGARTILSPIGLRVRSAPSRSAKILGVAAQGAVLRVLGHTAQGGGWYEVRGATVTGWILDRRTLSAPGTFATYSSGQLGALYPSAWTYSGSQLGITFHPTDGSESIRVRSAPGAGALGGVPQGYSRTHTETIVACGVTTDLRTYKSATSGSSPYLAEVRIPLDAHHALGIQATMHDLSQLQTVRDFVNSVTFPFPQCQG